MTNPVAKAVLTEQERRAHDRLQKVLLSYLGGHGASPEQLATSAYVQAITAFAAIQAVLELLRDRQIVSPEVLSRLVAEQYDRTARDIAAQPVIQVPRQ